MVENKIEKYNLTDRILALHEDRQTTARIAEIITQELDGADTISQATVARFLKPYRDEYKAQAHDKVTRHIEATIENDLQVMDEVEAFFYGIFKDADINTKERGEAGLKAIKVVETKLRYALIDNETGSGRCDPVDLSQFRSDLEDIKERNG